MKTLLLSIGLFCLMAFTYVQAQTCLGITFKPGMTYELTSYNSNNKPIGVLNYVVKQVRTEGGHTIVDIEMSSPESNAKNAEPMLIHYTCQGDKMIADMSGMANQSALSHMQMKVAVSEMAYPNRFSVGQTLDDGRLEAELLNKSGDKMGDMKMVVTNRKVEGQEKITTPAGSFDTYKVSSDMSLENKMMGIPIRMGGKVVNYRATNQIFDIRSEVYSKNGKLSSYTLLTKIN